MRRFVIAIACACMALALGPPAVAASLQTAIVASTSQHSMPTTSIAASADDGFAIASAHSPTVRPPLMYQAAVWYVGSPAKLAHRTGTFDPIDPGRSIA